MLVASRLARQARCEVNRANRAPKRLFVICYGSPQGFSHVDWQVVPLTPSMPFAQQHSFTTRPRNGVLNLSEDEMSDLATRIRSAIQIQ